MGWFSPFTREFVSLDPEEIRPEDCQPTTLLERERNEVASRLACLKADERAFMADLSELGERLRQTRISIQAFEAARSILRDSGQEGPKPSSQKLRGSVAQLSADDLVIQDGKVVKSRNGEAAP